MNCPVCDNVRLREVEKESVLIDVCPNCKGIWLDRGELEKITQGLREDRQYIEQSTTYVDDRNYRNEREHRDYPRNDKYPNDSYYPKKRKKKRMMDVLGDLFD